MQNKKTEAQLITELVVGRKVKSKLKVIPDNFWNLIEWKKEFQRQIVKANSLLKLFSYEVIMEVLQSKEFAWVWSLSNERVIESMAQLQQRKNIERKLIESNKIIVEHDNVKSVPKKMSANNLRNKLDE